MIENFYETPDGDLFVANGLDPVMLWDGFSDSLIPVGLDPPATALTMASSGSGPIVGTYYAYTRFVDADNNPSDLSPISAEFDPVGTTGTITGATNATPIVITSTAHGLTTGTTVKISGVGGNTSANNTFIITVVDADTFSLDDSNGTADYNGGGTWTSGIQTILYTNIPLPVEPKVVRRQILRNTDGQATTFYVDIDTTDLSSTTFSSTTSDSILQVQEAVPILDPTGNIFANSNAKPMDIFPFLSSCLDRMFLSGQIEYNIGNVVVTFGSDQVQGIGTEWKSTMANRFIYVDNARKPYEIQSVDVVNQVLTLIEVYAQPTSLFAFYSIKPPPAFRRIVAYSEAGRPQSWPPTNQLSLQETGDEITGLMQKGAYIYILENRHIHKLTFANDPQSDGAVFMVANRGVVNQRCWIVVDDDAYMLDELGVQKFSGNSDVEHLSTVIQSIFHRDGISYYKINWKWKQYFHATLNRQQEMIRWFVSMDGSRYPTVALCYQYRTNRWTIEGLPLAIGGTCFGWIDSIPTSFYGGLHRKIFAANTGTLDMVDGERGDVRSVPTSATSFTIGDTLSLWPTFGIVNAPIAIVDGPGKGQIRKIVEVDGNLLRIDVPWETIPTEESVYQIGAIHWRYRSGWMQLTTSERMVNRLFEVVYEPALAEQYANVRFFLNTNDFLAKWSADRSFDQGGGFRVIRGDDEVTLDMTKTSGTARLSIPSHKEYLSIGDQEWTQYEVEGFTNLDVVRLYQFTYEGMRGGNVTQGEQSSA
jgi:hypothetical protein